MLWLTLWISFPYRLLFINWKPYHWTTGLKPLTFHYDYESAKTLRDPESRKPLLCVEKSNDPAAFMQGHVTTQHAIVNEPVLNDYVSWMWILISLLSVIATLYNFKKRTFLFLTGAYWYFLNMVTVPPDHLLIFKVGPIEVFSIKMLVLETVTKRVCNVIVLPEW